MKELAITGGMKPLSFEKGIEKRVSGGGKEGDGSFVGVLRSSIQQVDELQKQADMAAKELAIGKADNIHDVAIAIEKADISFRLMVQVRNKVIEAYQEIMRMPI